jgi:RNA-directed DNA polymerase
LKPSKTQVVHTLERHEREPGFNFLGFNVRQYPAGKTHSTQYPRGRCLGFTTTIKPSKESVQRHVDKLRDTLHKNRSSEQGLVIQILSPKIVGWCAYFATSVCKDVFQAVQSVLFAMLFAWAVRRHPNKGKQWVADKYWRHNDGLGWIFQPRGSGLRLPLHGNTRSRRHTKVAGRRSPYDGDWVYWSTRMGREPTTPTKVARLLKEQGGTCQECGLYFRSGDRMEIDHVHPKAQGGTSVRGNLQLLHRHCHDRKTARDRRCA